MPCTTPPSTSGSREPLGWTCRTVRSWTPWWTSPMPWGGSWAYADGGPRTRQGSPVTAGRRTVPTPRSPTRRRQQQSSAGWRRRNAQKMRSHRCDRAFCRGGNFSKYRGQLGFGSHLGSIANRLFLYTFGIIVGDTHKFQYRATGVQLLHCCHLMGDGRWTAMATHAFPCR